MSIHYAAAKIAISAPLYRQVRDLLADRISAGEWSPGQTLPNEGILAEEFGVSIGTVRRAVQSLEDIGIVARKQGRGTFVRAPDLPSALEESLCRIRARDGTAIRLARQHIHTTHRRSTSEEATAFEWAEDGDLIEVASLILASGQPIGIERSMGPAFLLQSGESSIEPGSGIYSTLRRRGIQISRFEETISIVEADSADMAALQLTGASPVLRVRRIAYMSAAEPVEVRMTSYRPERVVYSTSLG